ncbi:MAG: HAD family hydrolase [Angustibacter sp.]
MRAGVDAVLLDIDDTLVDTQASFRAGMSAVAQRYLPHVGADGPHRAYAHWVTDRAGHYSRYTAGEIDFLEQRRRRAAALHADLGGRALDAPAFVTWNEVYETAFTAAWSSSPGAAQLLDSLVGAGVPIGAVTNAETSYQRRKLAATGLEVLPVLVGTDTLGVGKPDPRVFLHACHLLGTAAGRTVYVGNDLQVDARAARAAGLIAVWLDQAAGRRASHREDHLRPPIRTGGAVAITCAERDFVAVPDLAAVRVWLGLS